MAEQSPESQERIWAEVEKMRLIFLLKFFNIIETYSSKVKKRSVWFTVFFERIFLKNKRLTVLV